MIFDKPARQPASEVTKWRDEPIVCLCYSSLLLKSTQQQQQQCPKDQEVKKSPFPFNHKRAREDEQCDQDG